jgi:hypothetical protein
MRFLLPVLQGFDPPLPPSLLPGDQGVAQSIDLVASKGVCTLTTR